ncbi:DUF3084 domain-containing protein [Spirulina sp. 06S082]|uniref:DUF3084 domain-containing protein n=1 Tax=Spirulina sp. 06S082 TaxID=3110248 RepID=UPI002B1F5ACE|nr:DUF3084 domain-containing protein [Spirulina sp. 06S082]MEA5468878.1 DUF3084 domain-containing protein [Spirulina sp. 06S082]
MTSAYVLIFAILVLGGFLAVVGDRIGSKVGKARLRLFGLRPRKTAVVMTVVTGTSIAASTLGIIFALSESLRDGVFRLDKIYTDLHKAQQELAQAFVEQEQVTQTLQEVSQDKERVEQGLKRVEKRYQETTKQAQKLGGEVKQLRVQREKLVAQIPKLQEQVKQRDLTIRDRDGKIADQDSKIRDRDGKIADQDGILRDRTNRLASLQTQRNLLQAEISKRDSKIQNLDTAIADRDTALQGQEENLERLDRQLSFLQEEVSLLEEDRQNLRQGNVALVKGEVLSFAVLRVIEPPAARSAVDRLLQEANRRAKEAVRPLNGEGENDGRVVFITQAQVEQLLERIQDGQEYVVRVLSAENYVEQEERVRVFADVAFNERIFREGETIATVSVDTDTNTREDVKERLNILLSEAQFRARRSGVLGSIQIEEGRVVTFSDFIDLLSQSSEPIEQIQAIAIDETYTAGPLKMKLIALSDDKVIFSTTSESTS